MKIPSHLRAPEQPPQMPSGIEIGARPANDTDPVPKEAQSLSERAVEAGWQVLTTYAEATGTRKRRGPAEPESGKKYRMVDYTAVIPSIAVRMLNPGREMRIAIWKDGAFDMGLRLLPGGIHRVGAAEVKDFSGSSDANLGQHRVDG